MEVTKDMPVGDVIERKTQAVDPAKFFGAQPVQQPAQPQQMFTQPVHNYAQQPTQVSVTQPVWGQQQAAAPAQFQQPQQTQQAQPYYGGLPPQFQK